MRRRPIRQPEYLAKDFYLEDFFRTLFPLSTNRVLVEWGADKLLDYGMRLASGRGHFLPQRRVYASKDALHLRRTVKLDPVAEYYLYSLVFRNRARFRKPAQKYRRHFGYRFEKGVPIPASRSYAEFKNAVWEDTVFSEEFVSFDVSAYFNGLYHHDLHAWFADLAPDDPADVDGFGKFLREINAGRTLDCLPQGLYPTKMIGNDFLRFIEESSMIGATRIDRFMDDVYLFSDNVTDLHADFAEVQRLLGLKGLSINAGKTQLGGTPPTDRMTENVSELKKRLLRRRRYLILSHYDELEDIGTGGDEELNQEEIQFILDQLKEGQIGEDDAELIMVVMRDHIDQIESYLPLFARGYPHLAKNFFGLCREAADKEAVAKIVLDIASGGDHVPEYQLFWFGVMLETYLTDTKLAPDLVRALYRHPNATDITRAKVLEIPDSRFGLPEMREAFLREGRSDWLAWASAVGSRGMDKQARNYLLGYFANGSEMNRVIAEILQSG